MIRSCENCIFLEDNFDRWCYFYENEKENSICNEHSYVCVECGNDGAYANDGKVYCEECIMNELNIETCTITQFMKNGEFVGEGTDFEDIIDDLHEEIEVL